MRIHTFLMVVVSVACTKDAPKPAPAAAAASATPSASASATAAATASATATASASATTAGSVATKPTAPVKTGGELPGGEGMTAKGGHWEIVVPAPRTCDKGSDCGVVVRLTATDGFHVNKDYPTKLTLDDAPNIEMLGKDAKGKNVFSKAAGDFVLDGEQVGTMSAKVKPSAPGLAKVGGTLKFSVCSQANCQMETAHVKATIPVR